MITVSLKRYNIKNTTQKHLIPINKIIPKSKKKTLRQTEKDKEKRKRETNKKLIVRWSLTKLSNVGIKDNVLNQLGITILWNHYSLKHILNEFFICTKALTHRSSKSWKLYNQGRCFRGILQVSSWELHLYSKPWISSRWESLEQPARLVKNWF